MDWQLLFEVIARTFGAILLVGFTLTYLVSNMKGSAGDK